MAHPAGLEPATYCLEGSCSIQLSYGCLCFVEETLFFCWLLSIISLIKCIVKADPLAGSAAQKAFVDFRKFVDDLW